MNKLFIEKRSLWVDFRQRVEQFQRHITWEGRWAWNTVTLGMKPVWRRERGEMLGTWSKVPAGCLGAGILSWEDRVLLDNFLRVLNMLPCWVLWKYQEEGKGLRSWFTELTFKISLHQILFAWVHLPVSTALIYARWLTTSTNLFFSCFNAFWTF